MTGPLEALSAAGVAVWVDSIARDWLRQGELRRLRDQRAVVGVTSNPTIFAQALLGCSDYDDDIRRLGAQGLEAQEVFEALMRDDIRAASDDLEGVFASSERRDGWVSYELPPSVADDTEATAELARRSFATLGRPNVMIKIPATAAGIPAIRSSIAAGINVNVTLIFSLARYRQVIEAYLAGLEDRLAAGHDLAPVASVASFFVSRLDSAVDPRLEASIEAGGASAALAEGRLGTAAIDNARLAYQVFGETFNGARWQALADRGARVQRPLWASTSTKNPAYRDVVYVEELIAVDTVNTLPLETLEAFADHGLVRGQTAAEGAQRAESLWSELADLGIVEDEVTAQLEREGVGKFADSYQQAVATVEGRLTGLGGSKTAVGDAAAGTG